MKNSLLEKKFLALLQDKDIKVVSFDIFETLVFRRVNKPTDIFALVGEHKYVKEIYDKAETFQHFRMQAENRARSNNSKLEDVTLELIYNELPLTKKQRKKIIKLELEEEYNSLYVNKQIQRWMKLCIKHGKSVILISDMYLSKRELKKLVLSKLKDANLVSKLYVSNEYNATKATGNLYPIVLEDLQIDAKELLHIGDNNYSDIQMAKEKNVSTLYYGCDEYVKEMLKIESNYIKHNFQHSNYRIQASLLNPFEEENERFFFNLGVTIFGPVMWEFAHWINSLAKENKISQVNCVMREGRIFAKYISKINKKLDVNLIYASRKSTFLPAIDIDSLEEDGFNFYKYRKFSIANFYDLFKLSIRDSFINEHKEIILNDANQVQCKNGNLLDYITKDFQSRIKEVKKNVHMESKLFQKYLKQLSYTDNSILIDFGGTGSILENISNALGDDSSQKINVLFYMHSSGFNKMLSSKTFTFLPFNQQTQQKIERFRRTPEFIEMLFNGINQTTIHYKKVENKTVEAITDFPYSDIKETERMTKAFDKGVDGFFQIAKIHQLKRHLYSSEVILDFISRIIEIPTYKEAKSLGNMYHDEGYGSHSVDRLITKKHIKEIKQVGIEKSYYFNAKSSAYKIAQIPWVQGAITLLNEKYIGEINSLKVRSINQDSIDKLIEILTLNSFISEVYVYGAGQFFIELKPILLKHGIKVIGILDTRAQFSTFQIDGLEVKSITNANLSNNSTIIVASAVFAIDITQLISQFANIQGYELNIINFYNGLIKT